MFSISHVSDTSVQARLYFIDTFDGNVNREHNATDGREEWHHELGEQKDW
jgi:hypothetical protein